MGKDINEKSLVAKWGACYFDKLSRDLKTEFPDMTGFSVTNLKYIKRFYMFYSQSDIIRQQVVDEFELPIFNIPWSHHIYISLVLRNPAIPEKQMKILLLFANAFLIYYFLILRNKNQLLTVVC